MIGNTELPATEDELLTGEDLADRLRVRPRTVKKWRTEGRGPKFFYVTHTIVRYRKSDVDAWIAEKAA